MEYKAIKIIEDEAHLFNANITKSHLQSNINQSIALYGCNCNSSDQQKSWIDLNLLTMRQPIVSGLRTS